MSDPERGIHITQLRKTYGTLVVLNDINLTMAPGTVLALLGPNGAGKTTAVRILTTLLKPDSGTATIGGVDVLHHPEMVQSMIGLAGQNAAVDAYLSGYENLRMLGRLYHLSGDVARKRASDLIEQFDLHDAAHRPLKTYSGGMRRRIDLAASLIVSPPFLFLDEPTTGLDPASRNATWEIIRKLVKSGTTLLLTTQYLEEADQLADRIAVIDLGNIIANDSPAELKRTIGGQQFSITFASTQDCSNAKAIFEGFGTTPTIDGHTLHVAIPEGKEGIVQLSTYMDTLSTSTLSIESYVLNRPTLDDVFLKLTHHHVISEIELEATHA